MLLYSGALTSHALRPSLRPWLLGRVYHNSILSLPAQTVPPTQTKKLCCYTQGTTSQSEAQTWVAGQSSAQQYNNIISYLSGRHCLLLVDWGLLLLYSAHYNPAPVWGSDHGCWAEYTTTVPWVSSTDSASHSGKKFLPEWEALSVLETEDTVVVYSAQQPWSEAGPGAGK